MRSPRFRTASVAVPIALNVAARGESRSATFVVRVTWRPDRTSGVVERVRTGERERFDGLGEIGRVIARMLDDKGGAS